MRVKQRAKRPRQLGVQDTILDVTWMQLKRSHIRELTIDEIARVAEVSKSTIYRWWPNKQAIVIDALLRSLEQSPFPGQITDFVDCPREALEGQVASLIGYLQTIGGHVLAQVLAEGQFDSKLVDQFNSRFAAGRRAQATAAFAHGQKAGVFVDTITPEFAVETIYAPIYRRLFFHQPLDNELVDNLRRLIDLYCVTRS